MAATLEDRFWAKVEKTEGCWNWTASLNRGYGQISVNRRPVGAHRVAYELLVGPIPDGLHLDHLCRNPRCVRPSHLEPVPGVVNVMRGQGFGVTNAEKTHCVAGHEFNDANTYIWPKTGHRYCRPCLNRRRSELKRRVRARKKTDAALA